MNKNKDNSLKELERIMRKQYPEATVQYAKDGEHIVIRVSGENGKGMRDIYSKERNSSEERKGGD